MPAWYLESLIVVSYYQCWMFYRFGQQFVDRVANPKDMVHFMRKKVTVAKKEENGGKSGFFTSKLRSGLGLSDWKKKEILFIFGKFVMHLFRRITDDLLRINIY